jgi:hypothetical protein
VRLTLERLIGWPEEPDYSRFDSDEAVHRLWPIACGIVGHRPDRVKYGRKRWVECKRCANLLAGQTSYIDRIAYRTAPMAEAMINAISRPSGLMGYLRRRHA